jgi:Flp pilus assembly protein TadG
MPSHAIEHNSFKFARTFLRNERGAVAIVFAFLVVTLGTFVGGAVDFARFYQMKSAYRDAIDVAALAAARVKQTGGDDEAAIAAANSYLNQVKIRFPAEGSAKVTMKDDGRTVEVTTTLKMSTYFLRLIRMDVMPLSLSTTAQYGVGPDVELSMMLDTTGSMSGAKLDALKVAVEDLIDIVVRDDRGGAKSRVGMAPFSNSIKLKTKHFRTATGQKKGKGCVVERGGADAYTDAGPAPGRFLAALEDAAPTADCNGGAEVFPLSDKKGELKKMVRAMSAGGSTAGHLGIAWAWYLLSPEWSKLYDADEHGHDDESASRPAPYDDLTKKNDAGVPKLRKIAVLMTDGEFNTQYIGPDSTTQARQICVEMKKTGIEVFTIGFEVGSNPTVIETLRKCATRDANFYNVSDTDSLKRAFRDIAFKSSPLRLAK